MKPRRPEQDSPKDDSNEKRERGDSRVEQAMQSAQSPRPAIEEHRATSARIAGCVDSSKKKIEAQTPVCQPGEVAERLADLAARAVGAVPGPDDDDRREDV